MPRYLSILSSSLLLSSAVLLAGCSANPVSGENQLSLISENEEVSAGLQAHNEVMAKSRVYSDAALQAYVNNIGQQMAAQSQRNNLHYTFTLLDDSTVNAFALPGGYIYITTGLMSYLNSEAELAGVLGHEIGHVAARHNVSQASWAMVGNIATAVLAAKVGNEAILNTVNEMGQRKYGRDQELQADGLAAEYLARAGYDPSNMANVIATLQAYDQFNGGSSSYRDLFSTHPSNDQRLQQLISQARQNSGAKRDAGHNAYVQHLQGLTVTTKTGQPLKLRVISAKAGDTFENLAQTSSLGSEASMYLRLLNGMFPNGQPQAGQLIKTVQ